MKTFISVHSWAVKNEENTQKSDFNLNNSRTVSLLLPVATLAGLVQLMHCSMLRPFVSAQIPW